MHFFKFLKQIKGIKEVVMVDIDKELLKVNYLIISFKFHKKFYNKKNNKIYIVAHF